MASSKWAQRRGKNPKVVPVEDSSEASESWNKRRRTGIKKKRAERARRNTGVASTNKRLGHQAKAAPSRHKQRQLRKSIDNGRPKRPPSRSHR